MYNSNIVAGSISCIFFSHARNVEENLQKFNLQGNGIKAKSKEIQISATFFERELQLKILL